MTLNENDFMDIQEIDIPDIIMDNQIEVDQQVVETPNPDDSGFASMIIDSINGEWDTIKLYNDIIVNAQLMGRQDIVDIMQDINAEENNHVGMLQALLQTISPNAENIKAGEEEAQSDLQESVNKELNEKIQDGEETVTRKFINQLNKITYKYNGFHEPKEIRNLWDELERFGIETDMIAGTPHDKAPGSKSWTVNWYHNGNLVTNSRFVYGYYEPQRSLSNDYTIYFS